MIRKLAAKFSPFSCHLSKLPDVLEYREKWKQVKCWYKYYVKASKVIKGFGCYFVMEADKHDGISSKDYFEHCWCNKEG